MIKYSEERAAEDTAFGQGLVPVWLCRLLLPVWRAEISATIRFSEPYDLIDRYVEAGISRGGLGTERELADFYGLDLGVAGGAVRFLESIGHLSRSSSGRLALSELGQRSVARGRRCYEVHDHRHLYFDGFTCQPLTRPFYDEKTVTFTDGTGGGDFTPVIQAAPVLDPGALTALADLPAARRDRFNLPEEVIEPELKGPAKMVYLPAYVMRATGSDGSVWHLVYTQASQESDPEWTQACLGTAVAALVDNEYVGRRPEGEENVRRWVGKSFAGPYEVGVRDQVLTATLPPTAFGHDRPFAVSRIGSFIKMGGWFFRLWCEDQGLRAQAMLDRTDSFLGDRTRIDDRDELVRRLSRYANQSGLGLLSPDKIAAIAQQAGRAHLADRITSLAQ